MTFYKSLECLRPLGYMVTFGQSSGKIESFDPAVLASRGSLFLIRPMLFDYIATREELERRAGEMLGLIASGKLKLRIDKTFPLEEAGEAHRYLEGRKSRGKILLIP